VKLDYLPVYVFADDILIYKTISTPNDHSVLQNDLDSLTQWLMEFDIPKCNILQFSTFTYKNVQLDW